MILKKWEDLPVFLKTEAVKPYYDSLKQKNIQLIIKRFFDVTASLILIIITFPLFLIIGVFIKLDSKGPIFYKQERVTQYGKNFNIYKFRTMYINSDKESLITISNDARITKAGKFLRKTKIDEIPQLFNVFIGDMTFVGTRPEVQKYIDEYTDEMNATLLLPAGITSLTSINYKDENNLLNNANDIDDIYISIILQEKMKLNLKELKSFSIFSDIKTMINTVFSILFK